MEDDSIPAPAARPEAALLGAVIAAGGTAGMILAGATLAPTARTGHGETSGGTRVGEVTIADLMPEALRQNLSRLVVGEVRGGEAAAMFEAMQAGTGTLSTTHSHSHTSLASGASSLRSPATSTRTATSSSPTGRRT